MKIKKRYRFVMLSIALFVSWNLTAAPFPSEPSFTIEKIPGSILGIAAGDVTGNGVLDLIVAGSSGRDDVPTGLWVYYNPLGRKSAPASPDRVIELRSGEGRPTGGLIAGDFEGDGPADIAVHGDGRRLYVLLHRENYSVAHAHTDNNQGGGMEIAGGGRMTHDDKVTDLFIGPTWRRWRAGRGFDRGRAYIYPGAGLGEGSGHNRYAPVIADLNNNGSGDMIFAGSTPVIRLFYGPFPRYGPVRSPMALDYVELEAHAPARYLAVGDLNGDGRPDIVASWSSDGKSAVAVYPQNSPMGFTPAALPELVIEGLSGPVLTGDLNGNGRDALLVIAPGRQGGIYVFEQKREGGLPSKADEASMIIKPRKDTFQNGILADLSNNGYPDLVVYGAQTINVFINSGPGGRPAGHRK